MNYLRKRERQLGKSFLLTCKSPLPLIVLIILKGESCNKF